MYVDYNYYMSTFNGPEMSPDDFRRAERAAEAYIRYLTFPNGDIFATEDSAVKNAVCAAAEAYNAAAQAAEGSGPIQSETNDGYSVTYASQSSAGETAERLYHRKMYEAARVYLLPTGWMNRRVGCIGAD